jgi:septum formation protein
VDFKAITHDNPLVLASDSPRRKRLLEQIHLPYRPVPSHLDENRLMNAPGRGPARLAQEKAWAVRDRTPGRWILGADTVVCLGEKVLGKPKDAEAARGMLTRLGGRTHEVVTGFCILDPSGKPVHSEEVTTRVRMRALSHREIAGYVATGESFGKAGSYAIQGVGAFMVESISGSYTNVVGLPVCALVRALLALGALDRFPVG